MDEYTLHKIVEYPVGSYLYGTNTETSDKDFSGIFIAPIDCYFGLNSMKTLSLSTIDKDKNNKNTKKAIDKNLYEILRFFHLAKENNPTIIEQFFVPKNLLIIHDSLYEYIFKNVKFFLHKGLYYRFLGYAYSQKKKMIVKLDRHQDYVELKNILENADPTDTLNHIKDKIKKYCVSDNHIEVGDIKIPKGTLIKKALAILNKRFESLSNRTELVKKHGYDTKFASHLIRLILEGIELLFSHQIQFPLQQADYLIDIKKGKYSLEDILNDFNNLEIQIKHAVEKSSLPKYPNISKINELSVYILNAYFYEINKMEIANAVV